MGIRKTTGAMWLPGPIYESLPYVYIVGGVLFFSGTRYIGIGAPGAGLYIACGLVSILYGAAIFSMRQAHRRRLPNSVTSDVT